MSGVLVIGRVRPDRRAELDVLLAEEQVQARVFRQGQTLALFVDGPRAEARFLRLIADRDSTVARVADCLEDVPVVPRELSATAS